MCFWLTPWLHSGKVSWLQTSMLCMESSVGTPLNPKGIMQNWYSPNGVVNAVIGHDFSSTGTCQQLLVRSRVVINAAFPSQSISSSTQSISCCYRVEAPVVYTEAQGAILLLYPHHRGCPFTVWGLNKLPSPSVIAHWVPVGLRQSIGWQPCWSSSAHINVMLHQLVLPGTFCEVWLNWPSRSHNYCFWLSVRSLLMVGRFPSFICYKDLVDPLHQQLT